MKRYFNLVFLVFFSLTAFAAEQNVYTKFDAEKASAQLKTMQENLINPKKDSVELSNGIKQLKVLQEQAEHCVSYSEQQLKVIPTLMVPPLDQTTQLQRESFKYLQEKEVFFRKQLSGCRLVIYHANELLDNYKHAVEDLSAYEILKQETPIWKIYDKQVLHSFSQIDFQKAYQETGISRITVNQLTVGFFLMVFAILAAFYVRLLCRHKVLKIHYAPASIVALVSVVARFIVPVTVLVFIIAFFNTIFNGIIPMPTLGLIGYPLLLFVLLLALASYLFSPQDSYPPRINFPNGLRRQFYWRFLVLITWVFFGAIIAIIFRNQEFPIPFIELVRTIFITILSFLLFWISLLFCYLPNLKKRYLLKVFIRILLSISLLAVVLIEWLGFHQLAIFVITGVLSTAILLAVTTTLWLLVGALYELMDNNRYAFARKVRDIFGVKSYKKLSELFILRFVSYLVLLGFLVTVLMRVWRFPVSLIDSFLDSLLNGFAVAGMTIVPSRIAIGLILFSLLFIFGRYIATMVAKKRHFEGEIDTQVAVASVITYVSFSVALLFALLIMGVNFTGLAIIAGALSVGVGLGLQNIVNNFISGIILLLEKPIKPGDRILIGNTEGFVKKVRIRSTQISTVMKEDVIVPNSDLITNQVTNYMFRDKFWRVKCQVGVVYGSDVKLVEKVLLGVAENHPEVVQEEPNQPLVFFQEFSDSSLVFELWSVINDVNRKYFVISELNFAIDAAFRLHNITIAFPQRDVHIRDYVHKE